MLNDSVRFRARFLVLCCGSHDTSSVLLSLMVRPHRVKVIMRISFEDAFDAFSSLSFSFFPSSFGVGIEK